MEPIVNKIAQSGLITLDLEQLLPKDLSIEAFDLKPFLFREMILKEKDFRQAITAFNWQAYKDKNVAVFCSADAIVPAWAFMLVACHLAPVAGSVFPGDPGAFKENLLLEAIRQLDISKYADQKIILKGCGAEPVSAAAYLAMSQRLQPIVKSLMYGEPCSTVPVYKRKK
ncbi:MAG TPA: DUF2480 family protein [Edaphocola sp.]|nr:DUF2480 family protein [Edaphocola sp.]